jgi:hypothetical protein
VVAVAPLPLTARAGFTLLMVTWVPVVLATQGPQNFWWLCNLAQFLVLVALWTSSRLLASSQAGTVVLVGLVWTLDFVGGLVLGESPTGVTAYMFADELPLALRATSTYHMWLPVFVLWLCRRQGYDERGVWLQCVIGTLAIVGSWRFGESVRNLNYTVAPFNVEQTWLPQPLYILLLCIGTALLVYLPGHLIVRAIIKSHGPRLSTLATNDHSDRYRRRSRWCNGMHSDSTSTSVPGF